MIGWLLCLAGVLVMWFVTFFLPAWLEKREAARVEPVKSELAELRARVLLDRCICERLDAVEAKLATTKAPPVEYQLVIRIYYEEQKPS
jgi:hypothetical protein